MRMTKAHALAVVLGSVLVFSAASAEAGPIRNRQARQGARIHQGVENGALTQREAGALRREQSAIEGAREQAVSDGHISRSEARRLTWAQDGASHDIYRLKHNGRVAE
jgi:hypothetical protein